MKEPETIDDGEAPAADAPWRRRLREAVAADGRGVVEISKAAGCNRSYLTGVLKGESSPRLDHLSRICAELGVSVAWVVDGIPTTSAERRMVELLERLSEDRRELAMQVLEAMAGPAQAPAPADGQAPDARSGEERGPR
jgi:transcriptional regulator with XRE-family HTH domain